jgi:hypothetical protein
MLLPTGTSVRIHIAAGVTDLRKGIDGLAMLARSVLKADRKAERPVGHPAFQGRAPRRWLCRIRARCRSQGGDGGGLLGAHATQVLRCRATDRLTDRRRSPAPDCYALSGRGEAPRSSACRADVVETAQSAPHLFAMRS